jgi:hypothetical protein
VTNQLDRQNPNGWRLSDGADSNCLTGASMAYLTDNVIGLSKRANESANPQYFVAILASIALISVLTLFYHLLVSPVFNAASNAASIALVAYAAFTVFRSRHSSTTNTFYLAAACTFTCLSIVFNFPTASVVDGIKYLSI